MQADSYAYSTLHGDYWGNARSAGVCHHEINTTAAKNTGFVRITVALYVNLRKFQSLRAIVTVV